MISTKIIRRIHSYVCLADDGVAHTGESKLCISDGIIPCENIDVTNFIL